MGAAKPAHKRGHPGMRGHQQHVDGDAGIALIEKQCFVAKLTHRLLDEQQQVRFGFDDEHARHEPSVTARCVKSEYSMCE